jgi:CRISPR/Cas system-associated endoribonuclease Cas2
LDFIQSKIKNQDNTDEDFDIAISIDINFKKGNSFNSIGMKYDQNGVPIILSEENIRERFPLTYSGVVTKCKERYSNFIQNSTFHKAMNKIKTDNRIHHIHRLDFDNKKSQKKDFYSTNIWKELDKYYTVKQQKKKDTQPNLFDDN